MKKSIFNFIYERDIHQNILYNTFSKALVILNDHELRQYNNILDNEDANDFISALRENGFVVDDDFDEINYLKYFHYQTKFSNDKLSLTIAPTLECNFACPYCYEKERKGRMNTAVQDGIIEYITEKAENGIKKIDITWYGGEPLICPEIIEYISSNVNRIAEEKKITSSISLVTNGYFLDNNIAAMLLRNNILNIQVTLDGLSKKHNERRFLKNGAGTFDRIISNLGHLKNTPIRVNIRMNVDNKNQVDFPELKKIIDGMKGMNIGLYPCPVENLSDKENQHTENYMSFSDYEQFIVLNHMKDTLCDGGLDVIDDRRYFCAAELENSYVVDEKGNFYKCWDEIGIEKNICFNILIRGQINYMPIVKYMADDPFSDPKCLACKFLPLCFGGCRFQKYLKKTVCNFTDKTVSLYLESKYLNEDTIPT